jgi:hypothetical protein
MAVYQRGTVFWWKARVNFIPAGARPTTIRMSLRTSSTSQARRRAQELELVKNAMMEQLPILRRQIKPDDLPAIFKRAFERERDRIILAQIGDPGRADDHRIFNLHYARYFTLLAEKPHLLDGSLESFEDLRAMGLSEADADALSVLARTLRHQPPVSTRYLAEDLWAAGIEPLHSNMKVSTRIAAVAYREASLAACEELGRPVERSEIWPLPHHIEKLADRAVDNRQSVPPTSQPPAPYQPVPSAPFDEPQEPIARLPQTAPVPTAPTIGEFAKRALDKRIGDGAWDAGRRRDIEAAVAIFIAANGDIPFNEIMQDHARPWSQGHGRRVRRGGHCRPATPAHHDGDPD